MYIKNLFKHLHKINKHKWYVFLNCCKAGIPLRGVLHDLSKYSPIELFESVKYYQGDRSPIEACKEDKGYSNAWLKHKGRNPHHYEYWQDNFDMGGTPLQMPYKDALELVCDYIGAGMAYQGKDKFSYSAEFDWWLNKKSKGISMHPHTILFIDFMLLDMKKSNNNNALSNARYYYDYATIKLS